jgi:hypothetical protein
MAAASLEEKVERLEKMVQRSQDVQEIQKVMSRHSFLDAIGANREQVMEIWAQTVPDVAFIQNHGMYVGLESIIHYYCDLWENKARPERLEQITKLFPEIPKEKQYDLAGWMKMHTNCTPYIVVAGDGKTAKGTWESPGFITEIMNGKIQAAWIWERFAVDFIKEDGKWKIWHFNALVQFMTPYEKSWVTSALEPSIAAHRPAYYQEPDIPMARCQFYNPKELCGPLSPNFPKQPVPYETFSETFSYGPPE